MVTPPPARIFEPFTQKAASDARKTAIGPISLGKPMRPNGVFLTWLSRKSRLMKQFVEWLKDAEHGLIVVTGPAGSGKSAVMDQVPVLSDPG